MQVSLWWFYRRTTVVNKVETKIKGPCIVIANHPSTVLDPLNVAVHIPRTVHFLANASLFKTRFTNWFFNTFFCIPIERYQDTGGKPLNNAASFAKATEFLSNGGCLFIAPEGSSYVERRIRKLKTGAARIALNTEAANDFKLGLRFLPAGINYSDPTQFRSTVLTIFGKPIRVADFQKDWEQDPVDAVKKLTACLHAALSELTLDASDEEEDKLLARLEGLVQNEQPLPPFEEYQRSQNILAKLKSWRTDAPFKLDSMAAYFGKYSNLSFRRPITKGGIISLVAQLILLFPIFLLGFLTHFLPSFITKKISDALNKDLHWIPTFKYCLGLLVYPFILILQIWLVSKLPGHWLTWAYILSIVPAGLVAEWWLGKWKALRAENFAEQKQMRTEMLKMLNL